MTLPRRLARLFCLVPIALAGCAGTEPAPEAAATPGAPAVALDSPNASGTPTAAAADGIPQAVYASQTELAELYEGEITAENLDALLDELEAEIEADASEDPN